MVSALVRRALPCAVTCTVLAHYATQQTLFPTSLQRRLGALADLYRHRCVGVGQVGVGKELVRQHGDVGGVGPPPEQVQLDRRRRPSQPWRAAAAVSKEKRPTTPPDAGLRTRMRLDAATRSVAAAKSRNV